MRGDFQGLRDASRWHDGCLVARTMSTPTLSVHTVRSRVLSRALLDRDLDPLTLTAGPQEAPARSGLLESMYRAAIGGDFDDDDPRWRRGRRARRPRYRA